MDYCRVCLKSEKTLFLLESSEIGEKSLSKVYHEVTSLDLNDGFSKRICSECRKQLVDAFGIRELAIRSLKTLQRQAEVVLRTESEAGSGLKPLQIVCSGCSEKFGDHRELLKHQKIKIADPNHQFSCFHCSKHFQSKFSLQTHMTQHAQKRSRYKCDQCKRAYSQSSSLQTHKKLQHSKDVLRHPCPQCGKTFALTGQLNKHIKLVHERKIVATCEYCSKGFVDQSRLKQHLLVHSSVKPIECSCGKTFANTRSYNVHFNRVHGSEALKCDLCPPTDRRVFKHVDALKRHQLYHTSGFPHVCEVCGKKFRQKTELQEHNFKHTGERPFVCPAEGCGKTYQLARLLHQHRRIHSGDTFDCHLCERKFTDKKSLRNHMQVHGMVEREKVCPFEGCQKAFFKQNDVNRHFRGVHLGLRRPKKET